jgi:hypothetical protein
MDTNTILTLIITTLVTGFIAFTFGMLQSLISRRKEKKDKVKQAEIKQRQERQKVFLGPNGIPPKDINEAVLIAQREGRKVKLPKLTGINLLFLVIGLIVVGSVQIIRFGLPPSATQASPTPPPTAIPSTTATLKPGETPVPTFTFTNIPTLVPTFTRTFTPIPPSPTVFVCPSVSHPVLVGQGLGGSADIYSPAPCTTGLTPETAIFSSGVYSNIPAGSYVWELVYAPDHLYYPQSPNACGGGAPPTQNGGNWSVNTYLGSASDLEPKWYDIIVVVADQAASDQLRNWLASHCPSFPGIGYETISQWNITEKVSITVRTR